MAIIQELFAKHFFHIFFLGQNYLVMNSNYEYCNQKDDWIQRIKE